MLDIVYLYDRRVPEPARRGSYLPRGRPPIAAAGNFPAEGCFRKKQNCEDISKQINRLRAHRKENNPRRRQTAGNRPHLSLTTA